MPSDAYLIMQLLLAAKSHPGLIIYGVGPRDFVDNLLASPASTDPYHCLSKYIGSEDKTISLFRGRDWQSKFEYFISEHFPLYGKRQYTLDLCADYGQYVYAKANSFINVSIGQKVNKNKLSIADVHNILPAYNPMTIGIKQCLFNSDLQLDPNRFNKSLNDIVCVMAKSIGTLLLVNQTFFYMC